MTPKSAAPETGVMEAERRDWMGVLARAPIDLLRQAFAERRENHVARAHVGPEVCLLQLRVKAPATGTPFHLGEATVTRCVVSVCGRRGYAVVLGNDPERSELAAFFDGLLQDPDLRDRLRADVLQPAAAAIDETRRRKADEARATAAHFFTAARTGEVP